MKLVDAMHEAVAAMQRRRGGGKPDRFGLGVAIRGLVWSEFVLAATLMALHGKRLASQSEQKDSMKLKFILKYII